MQDLEISILFSSPGTHLPEARFWIDAEPEQGFEAEHELPLHVGQGQLLSARLKLTDCAPSYLFYRLGLKGKVGTVWRLQIRDASSGQTLHDDADLLSLPKTYLSGSFNLVCTRARYRPPDDTLVAGMRPGSAGR